MSTSDRSLPSRENDGHREGTMASGRKNSPRVTIGVTSPPRAETRASRRRSANAEHDDVTTAPCAPRGARGTSVMVCDEPSAYRFVSICRRKESNRPAIGRPKRHQHVIGPDQCRDVNESSRRSQSTYCPFWSVATKTSCVPSGDNIAPLVPSARPIPLVEPNERLSLEALI